MSDDIATQEAQLRIALMNVQIDKGKFDLLRVQQEMRWEPWKALATILAAVAAMSGVIVGVAHLIR